MQSLRYLGSIARATRTAGTRRMGTRAELANKDFQKFKQTQEKFQIPDGELIHVKGGNMDRALFILTAGLTAVGVAMSFQFYYKMSFPKKD